MTNSTIDRAKKITISLPTSLLHLVDNIAQEQQSSRSAVIASVLEKLAQERFEEEMRLAYLENAEEAEEIAGDFSKIEHETWPEW